MVGERGVEAAGGVDASVDKGGVVFLNGEAAELGAEVGVGGGSFGGEDEAGGLRVEAMKERGEKAVVADAGEGGEAGDEGVGEGVGFGEAEGVGGLSGGFVEGEEEVIFEEDGEGQVGVGAEAKVFGFGDVATVEAVAGGEARAFFGGAGVEEDLAVGEEFFDGGAVEPGEEAEELPVESFAVAGDGVLLVGDHGDNEE